MPDSSVTTQTCPTVGYQSASICVPVTVTPFAEAGITFTKCCGNAFVTPGKSTCSGLKNGSCFFTISQDICVEVPVSFGAIATVGDTFVSCNGASADNICAECDVIPVKEKPEKPEKAADKT
ncbi:MAG: hypothetical protein RR230_08045 [Oscillospiraceae bacterium]